MLDDFDVRLLRAYQDQPDIPMDQLADHVRLSAMQCRRRLKRLIDEKYVVGKLGLVDRAKIGLEVLMVAHIKLRTHDEDALEQFERAAAANANVVECILTTGDYDYMIKVMVRDIDEYETILRRELLRFPNVESMSSQLCLKVVKGVAKVPI
jgi:Lrp/AsnC family transcriptional regulator